MLHFLADADTCTGDGGGPLMCPTDKYYEDFKGESIPIYEQAGVSFIQLYGCGECHVLISFHHQQASWILVLDVAWKMFLLCTQMLHTRCASLLGPQGRFDLTHQVAIYSAHNQINFFPPQVCQGTSHIFGIGPRLWWRLGFRSIVENRGKGSRG